MAEEYEVTINKLEEGIALSRKNAKRLAYDAKVLLSGRASLASVYGTWHLGVEELGKSFWLAECILKEVSPGKVKIPKSIFNGPKSHKKKFARGLACLPKTQERGFALATTVITNNSSVNVSIQEPTGGEAQMVVGPSQTGQFEDLEKKCKIKPTHNMRLQLLYVDFNGNEWLEPEAEFRHLEIMARNSISSRDLELAIEEFWAVLNTIQS